MARRKQNFEVYVRSIDRRWAEELRAAPDNSVVVSPYVTAPIAERLLVGNLSHSSANPTLLTNFSAEVFASGASDLSMIERLVRAECRVMHVNMLHAKIVLTRSFVSIGSQNVTTRGIKQNLEATDAITDPKHIEEVDAIIRQWMSRATLIDLDMINSMRRLVRPIRRQLVKIQKELLEADSIVSTEIRDRAKAAEEAEKARELEQKQLRRLYERSSELRSQVQRTHHSNSMNVTVTTKRWENWFTESSGSYDTMALSNPSTNDMRHWRIGGREIDFRRKTPCLLILASTGRLSLVLLKKVQTNQFGREGRFRDPFIFLDRHWSLEIAFASTPSELEKWNVRFIISEFGKDFDASHKVEAECYFGLSGIHIHRVSHTEIDSEPRQANKHLTRIEKLLVKGNSNLLATLSQWLLDARNHNWVMWMDDPNVFFGDVGTRFRLTLHETERGSVFLSAAKIH